ncbi:hypothetical protein TNCV_1960601 [Trichonephila clavipes]|nr:hypothetical protein TNCV_1960601 [Trichonephila clavipes]
MLTWERGNYRGWRKRPPPHFSFSRRPVTTGGLQSPWPILCLQLEVKEDIAGCQTGFVGLVDFQCSKIENSKVPHQYRAYSGKAIRNIQVNGR